MIKPETKIFNDSLTGKVPGREASNRETCVFIGTANSAPAPENNLESALIWAWISNPITDSQFSSEFTFGFLSFQK